MVSSLEHTKAFQLHELWLALALVIIRQKPAEIPIKEYILKIRHFIQKSSSLEEISSTKFFDSISFWKTAYERSEAEQVNLNNTIHELEQRIRGQGPEKKIANNKSKTNTTKKRSSVLEDISGNIGSNTRKRARSCNIEVDKADSVAAKEIEEEKVSRLPRQMFDLQRILQTRAPNEEVATEAVIMCKVAETELLGAVKSLPLGHVESNISARRRNTAPELCTIIHSAEIAFSLVYQALVKVTKNRHDAISKGRIIYYIVCLFESTMTCLNMVCTDNPKRGEVTQKLVDLLCKMTSSLDISRHEDQEIFEGFLYLILRRLGNMLALFAFPTHEVPAGSELTLPKGLTKIRQELSPKTAQPEARCLILILKNALSAKPSATAEELQTKKDFISDNEECLQKTLVQAVFGSGDALFKGGLVFPPTPPSINHYAPRESQSFPEWFTRELWGLVGWDVLSHASAQVQSICSK